MTDAEKESGEATQAAHADRPASHASGGENPGVLRDRRGAIFVEFLIAFLPVQIFFLCLIQLAILFSVRLLTEHAAVNGARAAAVVIGDDGARYSNEDKNRLLERGKRREAIRAAVVLTLAPMILNGLIQQVDVFYPEPGRVDGPDRGGTLQFNPMGPESVEKVRIRVQVESACRIGFASMVVCPSLGAGVLPFLVPTRIVRAEAIFPYQGASYDY